MEKLAPELIHISIFIGLFIVIFCKKKIGAKGIGALGGSCKGSLVSEEGLGIKEKPSMIHHKAFCLRCRVQRNFIKLHF